MAADKTNDLKSNVFTKGMTKDITEIFIGEGLWTHAINAINNSHYGETGSIGNEQSNFNCATVNTDITPQYSIIGVIQKVGKLWIIFSTNNVNSEIGIFDESKCGHTDAYVSIANNTCLGFKTTNIITGICKLNYDCTYSVYWQDGLNPDRVLNVDKIPYKEADDFDGCTNIEYTTELDCDKLLLHPLVHQPCLNLSKAHGAGQLINGSYFAVIAYSDNNIKLTDYSSPSVVQSLWSHTGIGGGLEFTASNLDENFKEYQLVIVSTVDQNSVAKIIGYYSTEQTKVTIDLINEKLENISVNDIPLQSIIYEKSDKMFEINNHLIRSGVTTQPYFNYQPLANQITVKWQTVQYPANYYFQGGHDVGYMRDEVYPFFIRWIYKTGARSASYHIPGRESNINDKLPVTGSDVIFAQQNYNWQVYDTSSLNLINQQQHDGSYLVAEGEMAYWESTERYPHKNPEVWGELCGEPIRHHKMPSNETTHIHSINGNNEECINILGVQFNNIQKPIDDKGDVITDIIGYEILRGSREGNRTIVAKGIFNNMWDYYIRGNTQRGLYQNYPYNDLREDKFLTVDSSGISSGSGSPSNTDKLEGPLLTSKKLYSFHSPETAFIKPYLGSNYMKVYTQENGKVRGSFKYPHKHPKHILITDSAFITASLIGVAIGLMGALGKTTTSGTMSAAPMGAGTIYNASSPSGTGTAMVDTVTGMIVNTVGLPGKIAGIAIFALNFTYYVGQGIDEILEIIRNLCSPKNYMLQYNSHGFYNEYSLINSSKALTRNIDNGKIKYIGGGLQDFDSRYVINNVNRNKYVALEVTEDIPLCTGDDTRQRLKDLPETSFRDKYKYPTDSTIKTNTSCYYGSIKVDYQNQYGQLSSIVQLLIPSCVFYLNSTSTVYSTNTLFGGDVYINRYTEKNPYYFFNDWMYDVPNKTEWDYRNYINGPYPRYWANFEKYDITDFGFEGSGDDPVSIAQQECADAYSEAYSDQDDALSSAGDLSREEFKDMSNDEEDEFFQNIKDKALLFESGGDWYFNRKWCSLNKSGVIVPHDVNYQCSKGNFNKYNDIRKLRKAFKEFQKDYRGDSTFKDKINKFLKGGLRTPSDFHRLDRASSNSGFGVIKNSYAYLFYNGVRDFYCESELNMAFRDYGEEPYQKFYDPYGHSFNNLDMMFRTDLITNPIYHKYDLSLSVSKTYNVFSTWGVILPADYTPSLYYSCFEYYPNRVVYSLQQVEGLRRDNWRNFLPLNVKDFPGKVNTMKSLNATGALVLFEDSEPIVFTGVDTLQTDGGVKVTLGDGGLFKQNFQTVSNADDTMEYGQSISSRAAVNTPHGLFWISQNLGKVMSYSSSGLDEISRNGMKFWFAENLPSHLLKMYPNYPLYDNPVAGIGCQAVYDSTYELIYFTKKDYIPLRPDLQFDNINGIPYYIKGNIQYPIIPVVEPVIPPNQLQGLTSYCNKPIDMAFILDITGSMGSSINNLKTSINQIADALVAKSGNDYRLSIITVDYIWRTVKNTVVCTFDNNNKDDFQTKVNTIESGSGMFTPEPTDVALRSILDNELGEFRDDAIKIIILITDAPPDNGTDRYIEPKNYDITVALANEAKTKDIMIYPITTGEGIGDTSVEKVMNMYALVTTGSEINNNHSPSGVIGDIVENIIQDTPCPQSCTFTASTLEVNWKEPVILSWTTVGSYISYINNGIGQVPSNGTVAVHPEGTTTYILLSSNGKTTNRCSVTITVKDGIETCPCAYDNPDCFQPCDWTLSYDPKIKQWISFHDWHPNFMFNTYDHFYTVKNNGLWKHNDMWDSYCRFYGDDYAWEIEYPISTPNEITSLRNIEYTMDVYKFWNDGKDFHHVIDENFDRAIIYNSEQISGALNLIIKGKNNPLDLINYPKISSTIKGHDILFSKEENRFRFNQFWDITKDRDEFGVKDHLPMWNSDCNGYISNINDNFVDYNKSVLERKKFRHYGNKIILKKTVSGDKKMILKLTNSKHINSPR